MLRSETLTSVCLTIGATSLLAWWFAQQDQALRWSSHTSGYILLAAIVFLTLFHLRKKLHVLPIGSVAMWLRCHLCVGWGSLFVFFAHIDFHVPNGRLEGMLAGLYVIVVASGIYGLYLTKTMPRRLSQMTDEVILERIPAQQRQLARQAARIARDSIRATTSTALAEFYASRLHTYFEGSRGLVYAALPNSSRRRRLLRELAAFQQYCSATERTWSDHLFSLIRRRDDLDYQHALQFKLRIWLFAHIGLTYSLLIVSLFHAVLALAFHGRN
jgi:hypothetical protein